MASPSFRSAETTCESHARCMPVALFCFRVPEPLACAEDPRPDQQPMCMCWSECDAGDTQSPEGEIPREPLYRVAISQLADDPDSVRAELADWLGELSAALDTQVGLVEVFTGQAPLSQLSKPPVKPAFVGPHLWTGFHPCPRPKILAFAHSIYTA